MSQPTDRPQTLILFLAANPDGLRRVGQELREIKEGLRRSQERDRFKLTSDSGVRPRDIQRALLDESPQIVHFAVEAWVQMDWSLRMMQGISSW